MVAWIGMASSLAALPFGITGIIVFLRCSRLPFSSATSLPESEMERFPDSPFSFTEHDPFVSQQKALSAGVLVEQSSEGFISSFTVAYLDNPGPGRA
jgi:hypothetical protein